MLRDIFGPSALKRRGRPARKRSRWAVHQLSRACFVFGRSLTLASFH